MATFTSEQMKQLMDAVGKIDAMDKRLKSIEEKGPRRSRHERGNRQEVNGSGSPHGDDDRDDDRDDDPSNPGSDVEIIEDDRTPREQTGRWRTEDVGFFDPRIETESTEPIIYQGKDIVYRDVYLFTNRLKSIAQLKGKDAVRRNSQLCLRGYAMEWFTTELSLSEQERCRRTLEKWIQTLIKRFKPDIEEADAVYRRERYTTQNAKEGDSIARHVHKMYRASKVLEVPEHTAVIAIWRSISPELRINVERPGRRTTISDLIQDCEELAETWKYMVRNREREVRSEIRAAQRDTRSRDAAPPTARRDQQISMRDQQGRFTSNRGRNTNPFATTQANRDDFRNNQGRFSTDREAAQRFPGPATGPARYAGAAGPYPGPTGLGNAARFNPSNPNINPMNPNPYARVANYQNQQPFIPYGQMPYGNPYMNPFYGPRPFYQQQNPYQSNFQRNMPANGSAGQSSNPFRNNMERTPMRAIAAPNDAANNRKAITSNLATIEDKENVKEEALQDAMEQQEKVGQETMKNSNRMRSRKLR